MTSLEIFVINKYADGLYFASKYSSISIVTELLGLEEYNIITH